MLGSGGGDSRSLVIPRPPRQNLVQGPEQAPEVAAVQDQQHRRRGVDGDVGLPRRLPHQRELPEVAAGAVVLHRPAVHRGDGRALLHEEELGAPLALLDDPVAFLADSKLADVSESLELHGRHESEHVNGLQELSAIQAHLDAARLDKAIEGHLVDGPEHQVRACDHRGPSRFLVHQGEFPEELTRLVVGSHHRAWWHIALFKSVHLQGPFF
mmetsp:Transcript_18157/g.63789  ORF Transcript_18157/g.63789 Transcript_18157/m.63789 type:complete len:212 (+) Transcript_18157:3208-3843(+)